MESFSFDRKEILDILRKDALPFYGSAMSTWQSAPVLFDKNGSPLPPLSDWEHELKKNLAGRPSGIRPPQRLEDLPRFFGHEKEYVDRSKELGQSMFRLSLEFGRLSPAAGVFDEKLMKEYVRTLVRVRARGQEPMLTLQHFTMPKFLLKTDEAEKITAGAWEHPDVLEHFASYIRSVANFLADAEKIAEVLVEEKIDQKLREEILSGGLVRYFMSINEPVMTIQHGYITGLFPPFRRRGFSSVRKILNRLVAAHDIARNTIKEVLGRYDPQVGVGYNWQNIDGAFGPVAHAIMNKIYTSRFERDGTHSDFLGLQYYFRKTFPLVSKGKRSYSDYPGFGDICPEGILEVLKKMHASYPGKEIFITEFGFSDATDKRRPYWILETFRYVIEAKRQNIPVKGLLLWSLVNNFEWHLGMTQKFAPFDESDLGRPLLASTEGIRTWEAWKAVASVLADPTEGSLRALQTCYETARTQYDAFLGG